MAKRRQATDLQITDAITTMQKICETETFRLTAKERLAIMDAKHALKILLEMRGK